MAGRFLVSDLDRQQCGILARKVSQPASFFRRRGRKRTCLRSRAESSRRTATQTFARNFSVRRAIPCLASSRPIERCLPVALSMLRFRMVGMRVNPGQSRPQRRCCPGFARTAAACVRARPRFSCRGLRVGPSVNRCPGIHFQLPAGAGRAGLNFPLHSARNVAK